MQALTDVGEVIPRAKKHLKRETTVFKDETPSATAVTLKLAWPEPKWKEMCLDGVNTDVLAGIYGLYHSLAKSPIKDRKYSFYDEPITLQMWEDAYVETVTFIRQACEHVIETMDFDAIREAFDERFNDADGRATYFSYAAGTKTSETFTYALAKSTRNKRFSQLLPYLKWPLHVNAKKIPYIPVELTNKNTGEKYYRLCTINKRSLSWPININDNENKFSSYIEAVDTLVHVYGDAFTIKKKQTDPAERYVPKKTVRGIVGVSEAFESVSADTLMQTFGFRGIQFGVYITQKERQSFVDNTFHSMSLLASYLNVPLRWIGGGRLALAFGARGHGYAAAHYERDLRVINLTRFNGPACLAHEIFHSIDARLYDSIIGGDDLVSESIDALSVQYLDIDTKTRTRLDAFMRIVKACTQGSDFSRGAKRITAQKGVEKYWCKPCELCARAFEAFIQDKMISDGVPEQWLAHGTLDSDYDKPLMHPYPVGEDRKRINAVFEDALRVIFSPN